MSHTLQERYSSLVLAKLRATSIMLPLMNRKYEGTPTAGAVKIPVRDTEVSVGSYVKASGGSLDTNGATSYQTLNINQDIYVNELIDGFDAAAVPDNLIADRLDSAGYAIANYIDTAILTMLTTGGNYTAPAAGTDTTDAYNFVVDIVKQAKKTKVDVNSLRLVVNNDLYAEFQKNDKFIHATSAGDGVIANGFVGRIAGVNVYETANMPVGVNFVLTNTEFAHFVDEWLVPVAVKDLPSPYIGASAVQGRRVYGMKVSRPTTIIAGNVAIAPLDLTLSALAIGGLTLSPTFDKKVGLYTTTTTNATNTITATATDTNATVTIKNGTTTVTSGQSASWSAGQNVVTITVENKGFSNKYVVVVAKS